MMRPTADTTGPLRPSTMFGDAPRAPSLSHSQSKSHSLSHSHSQSKSLSLSRCLCLSLSLCVAPFQSLSSFWYWFRVTLPLTAPLCLMLSFLVPFFFFNATDGFIFFGGALSIVFGSLAVLSYFQIPQWRRHPSSLMVQICVTSVVISVICLVNAYPTGQLQDLKDGSGINVVGEDGYDNAHDHVPACVLMSFFIQLTLLAREMWILTLSLDLLTSITNPFASYTQNLRKYHTTIWLIGVVSSMVLVIDGRCQGEFLSNGTCWLKISGVDSLCFWGFFMSWIILFYINAMAVLTYAYTRITKGLESTFATRFAFVADTFRVVFFYFFYGLVLAVIFLLLYYGNRRELKKRQLVTLEHLLAFLISARGFFDALVWFFSHGFLENDEGYERDRDVIYKETLHNRRLFMRDIVKPEMIWKSVFECLSCCCCWWWKSNSADDSEGLIIREKTIEDEGPLLEGHQELPYEERRKLIHDSDPAVDVLVRPHEVNLSPDAGQKSKSHKQISFIFADEDGSAHNSNSLSRGSKDSSLLRNTNATLNSGSKRFSKSTQQRTSDIDVSPQLNLALREEVLQLVTQGIKESVTRMTIRDKHGFSPNKGSPDHHKYGSDMFGSSQSIADLSQSASSRHSDEFERIRLSDASERPSGAINNPHITAANTQSNSATKYRSMMGFFSHSFYPAATQAPPSHFQQSRNKKTFNNALHGLMSAVGAYIPGEYGVDPINDHLEQSLTSATSSFQPNLSHSIRPSHASTSIYDDRGVPVMNQPSVNYYPPVGGINPVRRLWPDQDDSKSQTPIKQSQVPEQQQQQQPANVDGNSTMFARSFSHTPSKNMNHYLDTLENITQETREELLSRRKPPPAEVIFLLNGTHPFRDFRPSTFRKLRQLCEISDEHYLECISQPTQEKLSEGKSGAFFFLCGDGEIVVKTVEKHEATTLLSILDKYFTHLVANPHSLIVRFLGLHSIKMYGNEFTFVVMKNIFPSGVPLNEKYDIKGSWIQRNSSMPSPGKLCTCRYCGEQYIEGSNDMCAEVVGGHEAIVTLKDNDLITKIRLYPEDAYQIIDTLHSDSDALCAMGVMDYSLLVGVKFARYDVDTLHKMQHPVNHEMFFPPPTTTTSATNGLGNNTDTGGSSAQHSPVPNESHFNPKSMVGYPARVVIAPKEYHFGVIDILQTWSWSKKLERLFKIYVLGQASDGISCMNPYDFRDRYQRKIGRIIEHANIVREVTGSWQGKRDVGSAFPLVEHNHNV